MGLFVLTCNRTRKQLQVIDGNRIDPTYFESTPRGETPPIHDQNDGITLRGYLPVLGMRQASVGVERTNVLVGKQKKDALRTQWFSFFVRLF